MKRIVVLILLFASVNLEAQPIKKILLKVAEHVSLGAGTELGMYEIAGGSSRRRVAVGLSTAALVAGFKESADAVSGADTKKQAAWHAFSILAGAGIAAAVKH